MDGQEVRITLDDVEIYTEDIPGWAVTNEGTLTVALDIALTDSLIEEGLARELVNRIQNMRKDKGLDVTDKIDITVENNAALAPALQNYNAYICSETLARGFELAPGDRMQDEASHELAPDITVRIRIEKASM